MTLKFVQYLYVKNNPVIYIDPDGMRPVPDDKDLYGVVKVTPVEINKKPEAPIKPQEKSTDKVLERTRVFISGHCFKTLEELAKAGEPWANWQDTLYTNVSARVDKLSYIEEGEYRTRLIDEIIYQEAEKLQNEFRVLYSASQSPISSIIHDTLDDLYTEYERPDSKTLASIFVEGFLKGVDVGLYMAAMQAGAEYHRNPTNCGNSEGLGSVEPNKLNHLFGKAEHNFDALLESFCGNQSKAYMAIENAAQSYVTKNNITGVINATNQITVKVSGYNVTVRGNVVDGVLKLGTAFIKP